MERTVSPADCAMAVALPLTLEEFIHDAASPDKDFARSVVDGSGRTAQDAWREVYLPKIVALYTRVEQRARALRATVVPRVTATALSELLARFPLVSLFAHSVSAPVRPADVVQPRAIVDAVERGETVVARRLRDALGANRRWASEGPVLRDQVAAALDEVLAATRAWSESTVRVDRDGRPDRYVNRVMLEDCFGAALRRAPLIELHDGIKTMSELLLAVPPEFAGVLDLSVCNSVALGESIKRQRPRCLVVENVFLARIDLRLARYALVLNRLALGPARYTDALTEINRILLKD